MGRRIERFLESPLGQTISRGGRFLEKKAKPKWAKERDFYEWQEQQLANPETREAYIQSLRAKIASLIPQEILPTEEELSVYEPKASIFLRPSKQAIWSDHNIPHHAIVLVGAMDGARYVKNAYPDEYGNLNEQAIAIAAAFHDTQRKGDIVESMLGGRILRRHGVKAAQRMPELIASMPAVHVDPKTLALIQEIVTYHDVDRQRLGPNYTPELGIVVAADRAALQRLFSSRYAVTRLTAGGIAAKRMKEFKNGGIASDKKIFDVFTQALGALDIMVKQELAKGYDRALEFQLTLDKAKELGMVKDTASVLKSAA